MDTVQIGSPLGAIVKRNRYRRDVSCLASRLLTAHGYRPACLHPDQYPDRWLLKTAERYGVCLSGSASVAEQAEQILQHLLFGRALGELSEAEMADAYKAAQVKSNDLQK